MALHIQMSDEALEELRKNALTNRLVSAGVCLGLLLLFGGILYFTILYIQGDVQTEFITYTPPADDGPPTAQPVTKELSSKSAASSPSVTPSVIVAQNAVSAVAAPVSLDTTGDLSFDDLNVSLGMGGLGDGLGTGGSGLGSGSAGGSALEGTFYDLKLTKSGAPSKIPQQEKTTKNGKPFIRLKVNTPAGQSAVVGQMYEFMTKNWNTNVFAPFYSSKHKLYASSFFVPYVKAEYAPYAYDCSDTCQDAGWVCVYKGRVRAPKTGKFRFVGTADDFIAVRFNNKVVLEAGYRVVTLFDPSNPGNHRWWISGAGDRTRHWAEVEAGKAKGFEGYELIQVPGVDTWNRELGGLTAGKVFEVKEGEVYPIQVILSEIPGGAFGCVLLIEDVTNGKSPAGSNYDLFRTNFSSPTKMELYGLIEKANYSEWLKSQVDSGKMTVEEMVRKTEEFEWPPKKWPPTWNATFFVNGGRPSANGKPNPDPIQLPAYNEDSPIWTAVP